MSDITFYMVHGRTTETASILASERISFRYSARAKAIRFIVRNTSKAERLIHTLRERGIKVVRMNYDRE